MEHVQCEGYAMDVFYIKTPEYQKILKEFLQEHFQKDLKSDVLQKALAGHIMVKRGDKYEILK